MVWLINMFYCAPQPISRGVRMRSGENVLLFQGPTLSWGLGGSDRICRLGFFIVLPMVSIPAKNPALSKFWFIKSPLPEGFNCAHWLLGSLGRRFMLGSKSPGVDVACLVQLGADTEGPLIPLTSSYSLPCIPLDGWYPDPDVAAAEGAPCICWCCCWTPPNFSGKKPLSVEYW